MFHPLGWPSRVRALLSRHRWIVYTIAAGLVVIGAVFPEIQLYTERTIPPANWNGILQYPFANRSAMPTGSIRTTFFQILETNPQPLTLNLTNSSWNATTAFVTIYGGPSGLQITARDQGSYSRSPLHLNASILTILFVRVEELSYVQASQCDFQIRSESNSGTMRVALVPGQGTYPDLVSNATGGFGMYTVVEYIPRTQLANIVFRARGVSLGNAGNQTNLSGTATVDVESYSVGYFGLTESGQRFLVYPGAAMTFQTPTVQLENLNGYLSDGAGHGGILANASVQFGTPVSFEIRAILPINPSGNTARIDTIATGAEVQVLRGGISFVPNDVTIEPPIVRDLGFAAGGAMTFVGGLLTGIATRSRVDDVDDQ